MKIKDAKIRSVIICCNSTAEVLSKGIMGTRVKVLTVPDNTTGFPLGRQIWSNESVVELAPGEPDIGKEAIKLQIGNNVPLTLF